MTRNEELVPAAWMAEAPLLEPPAAGVFSGRVVRLVAALLSLGSGLLNIYSVVGPGLPERVEWLRQFLPLEAVHWSRSLVLISGFALVVAALPMLRRKHRAWQLVMAMSVSSVVLHLVKGADYEEAGLSALLALGLWAVRSTFTVRSREVYWQRGLWRVAVLGTAALGYGVLTFWLLGRGEFGIDLNWRDSVVRTLQIVSFGDGGLTPRTPYATWFRDSLWLMSASVVIYALWSLFRPVLYRFRTHPAEMRQARQIVEAHGGTAQDFFKYSDDKSFYFSPGGSSFLAYRVGADFAVVLGDPVGPEEEIADLVRRFVDYCRNNGWRMAIHQATGRYLEVYLGLGLQRLKVGDDAVVDLTAFTLEGKAGKAFRAKLNQFSKLGITATLHPVPVPEEVLNQAEEVSNEWLQLPGRRERQFTLGRFDREYLRNTEMLTAEDRDGRMQGFVNLIPSYRQGEGTLDLMRRRKDAPNGIMDFLFLRAFALARERGLDRFNLGMAPMSGFQPGENATMEERAVHAFFQRLTFVFSFQGLKAYKAKFATLWEPRYVIYRSALDLPLLPLALAKVSELKEEE